MKTLLVFLTSTYMASCLPPPHPAVVQVRREEEQLPLHLRSRALWNPHLQEVLPLTSLLHDGETPVVERETDQVPRQEIYNILTHAGFVARRPPHHQPNPNHKHHQRIKSSSRHQSGQHHNPHHHETHQQSGHQFNGHQFGNLQLGGQPFDGHLYGGHQPSFDQGLFGPYLGNPEFLQYL